MRRRGSGNFVNMSVPHSVHMTCMNVTHFPSTNKDNKVFQRKDLH